MVEGRGDHAQLTMPSLKRNKQAQQEAVAQHFQSPLEQARRSSVSHTNWRERRPRGRLWTRVTLVYNSVIQGTPTNYGFKVVNWIWR